MLEEENEDIVNGAGLVIYKKGVDAELLFLVLKARWGRHWSFPKGHLNKNESELVCALRETEEETNISQNRIQIVNDKRYIVKYKLPKKTKNVASGIKCVSFFIANVKRKTTVELSKEHTDFRWANRNDVLRLVRPEMGSILDDVIREIQTYEFRKELELC